MALATVTLKCPECSRFLAEVGEFGRAVCKTCGCEVTYRSRVNRGKLLATAAGESKVTVTTTASP